MIADYAKNYTKHINALYGYNVGLCTLKARGTYQFTLWFNPLEPSG
jgi:hypothetical protein